MACPSMSCKGMPHGGYVEYFSEKKNLPSRLQSVTANLTARAAMLLYRLVSREWDRWGLKVF